MGGITAKSVSVCAVTVAAGLGLRDLAERFKIVPLKLSDAKLLSYGFCDATGGDNLEAQSLFLGGGIGHLMFRVDTKTLNKRHIKDLTDLEMLTMPPDSKLSEEQVRHIEQLVAIATYPKTKIVNIFVDGDTFYIIGANRETIAIILNVLCAADCLPQLQPDVHTADQRKFLRHLLDHESVGAVAGYTDDCERKVTMKGPSVEIVLNKVQSLAPFQLNKLEVEMSEEIGVLFDATSPVIRITGLSKEGEEMDDIIVNRIEAIGRVYDWIDTKVAEFRSLTENEVVFTGVESVTLNPGV